MCLVIGLIPNRSGFLSKMLSLHTGVHIGKI